MQEIGSQLREHISETNNIILSVNEQELIVKDKNTGDVEFWQASNNFAGYVLEVNDIGFEFVRTMSRLERARINDN